MVYKKTYYYYRPASHSFANENDKTALTQRQIKRVSSSLVRISEIFLMERGAPSATL